MTMEYPEQGRKSTYWWKQPKGELQNILWDHVKFLEQRQSTDFWKDRIHESIYNNEQMSTGGSYQAALSLLRASGFSAARLNITRSMVDTVVARLAKSVPAIKVAADDVDWSFKLRARRLSRYIRGKQQETDFRQIAPMILRDAIIKGTGCLKVSNMFGETYAERVPKEELYVDKIEARYGCPRSMFHRKYFSREVLAEIFPEYSREIFSVQPAQQRIEDMNPTYMADNNQIDVIQAWHLPSSPDAKDGREIISIFNKVLYDRRWIRPRFPIAFMHWARPHRGFWGRGLVEDLAELQWKVNETVRDIQEALYFGAQLKVFIRRGSNIIKNHLAARHPHVVEYEGAGPPQYVGPNPVSDDQMSFLKWLIERAYDISGISEMSATGKKPPGLTSGVGLQEYWDQQTERFAHVENDWAHWNVDAAELYVDTGKEIDDWCKKNKKTGPSAKWVDKDVIQKIKWSDVDMRRDQFRLKLEPTNFLPETRAGKLEAVDRLAQAGIIQGPWVSMLMDFPDLEKANRIRNAALEAIEKQLEQCADETQPMPVPDSYMNLEFAIDFAKAELNRGIAEDAPDTVKQRYRDYVVSLRLLIKKQEVAAATPPAVPGAEAMPPGAEGPPGEMAANMEAAAGPGPAALPTALPAGPAPETLPGQAFPGVTAA